MVAMLRWLLALVAAVLVLGAPARAAEAGSAHRAAVYLYDSNAAATTLPANAHNGARRGTRPTTRGAWSPMRFRPSTAPPEGGVRPTAPDPRLQRALADDFRGGPNPIGDGSALDAARHTVRTGELVGGSTHLEKAVEMRDRYARLLRRSFSDPADEAIARVRYDAYRDFVREQGLDEMMRARGLR